MFDVTRSGSGVLPPTGSGRSHWQIRRGPGTGGRGRRSGTERRHLHSGDGHLLRKKRSTMPAIWVSVPSQWMTACEHSGGRAFVARFHREYGWHHVVGRINQNFSSVGTHCSTNQFVLPTPSPPPSNPSLGLQRGGGC